MTVPASGDLEFPKLDNEVSMAVKRAKSTAKKTSKSSHQAAPSRKPIPARGIRQAAKPAVRPKAKAAARQPVSAKKPVKAKVTALSAKAAVTAAPATLTAIVTAALEDMKAVNTKVMDVRGLTDIADTLVVASGNSDRHVRSIADRVIEHAKKAGHRPVGVEGERDGEWVLVDLQDVIVHVMLPRVREFYRLEDLWDVSAAARESAR
jgi:ribosome-associated protein